MVIFYFRRKRALVLYEKRVQPRKSALLAEGPRAENGSGLGSQD